jgi:hypothetical protein
VIVILEWCSRPRTTIHLSAIPLCEETTEVRRFAWLDEEFIQHISNTLRYQMRWCAMDGCDRISSKAVRKSIDAACPVG